MQTPCPRRCILGRQSVVVKPSWRVAKRPTTKSPLPPLTWREVADFRERLLALPSSDALKVVGLLRAWVVRPPFWEGTST